MILEQHVQVPADPDELFGVINDVRRVATCLPGAELLSSEDGVHHGRVTVKVGPITAAYAGTVRFLAVDETARTVRLSARGADTRGAGDAEASIELSIAPTADGSMLAVHTDLSIRGKVAQFGRSAISAVSGRLLTQFADNLAASLAAPPAVEHAAPGADAVRASVSGAAGPGQAAPAAPAALGASDRAGAGALGVPDLVPASWRGWGRIGAAFAIGLAQGWLLARLRDQSRRIEELLVEA